MEFIDKVRSLCEEYGTSVKQLEKALGYSNGSLSKGTPNSNRLYEIARYFGLPMEYFLTDTEELERYYERIQTYLDEYMKKNEKPLYRASAGQGVYNGSYADDSIEVAEEGYEYAEIVGDSMYPVLHDGDIVKIEPTTETSPTDLTLVKIDGETASVKYVSVVSDGVWLKAENKDVFQDRFYTIQEVLTLPVSIQGKVVEFKRKV